MTFQDCLISVTEEKPHLLINDPVHGEYSLQTEMDCIYFEDVEWRWHGDTLNLTGDCVCRADIIEQPDDEWGPLFLIKVTGVVTVF